MLQPFAVGPHLCQVYVRLSGGVGETVVQALARILLHMQPGNTDALGRPSLRAARGNIDPSMLGQRLVELRDLVALGQVWIKYSCAQK